PASQNTPVAKTAPPPAASAPMGLSVPEKGASYIQVAAQMRPAADATAKTLARAGWPTILAESSKPDWVEILVGPFRDGVTLADAKRKLIDQGFSAAEAAGMGAARRNAFRIAEHTEAGTARAQPAHGLRIGALLEYSLMLSP